MLVLPRLLIRWHRPAGAVLIGSVVVLALAADAQAQTAGSATEAESLEQQQIAEAFFEQHIRPALIEHCLDCHSSETEASGGLLLDSKSGWQSGGALGPAITPGDPSASLLIEAIEYENPDLQMPPEGKLDPQTVALFRQWIDQGALDPRAPVAELPSDASGLPVARAEEHWAYRSIELPTDLSSADSLKISGTDSSSPIDLRINRRLSEQGLTPAPSASRRELVRRLTFDLHGLPPTSQQVDAFLDDDSPAAYARLVDRLLASPHYGEHFARRWMDVVRYAESITLRGFVLPQAWRYRDYLITAFAEDRPFDRMIREQIAGDLIGGENLRQRQLAATATGFLALGNTNLEDQDKTNLDFDHIDEQLETIGRAFLAQTIGCARCHDHKFDPIPTRDYYALAAIFRSTEAMDHANVSKWIERPLPLAPAEEKRYASLADELKQVEDHFEELKQHQSKLKGTHGGNVAVADLAGVVVDNEDAKFVGFWKKSAHTKGFVGAGYQHDNNEGRGEKTATFQPRELPAGKYEVRLSYTAGPNRASNVQVMVFSANESQTVQVNQRQQPPESGRWISLGQFPFEENGQAFVMLSNAGADGYVIADAVQFLPQTESTEADPNKPSAEAVAEKAHQLQQLETQLKQLQSRETELQKQLQQRPKYLTVREAEPQEAIAICIRGDVHSRGDEVPRGFLTAIAPAGELVQQIDSQSSGRVALADWIADPRNPLTPRVYANRIWSVLMGEGLVATENNFGTTGRSPSHPELLDWLATELVHHRWSTKHLVRTIVCSEAYRRRRVQPSSKALTVDPSNRLHWSANLKRIPVEAIRDAMLCLSGELDRQMYGSEIDNGTRSDYDYKHDSHRRSLYSPVFRNSLPPLFRDFDFADPSVSVGQRPRSTVPTQSLAMMNSPWIQKRATAAAQRWSVHEQCDDAKSLIRQLYRHCFARAPQPEEIQLCLEFLDNPSASQQSEDQPTGDVSPQRLQLLIHSLFASLEFRYVP